MFIVLNSKFGIFLPPVFFAYHIREGGRRLGGFVIVSVVLSSSLPCVKIPDYLNGLKRVTERFRAILEHSFLWR